MAYMLTCPNVNLDLTSVLTRRAGGPVGGLTGWPVVRRRRLLVRLEPSILGV